jgi:hypothetical protein
MSFSFEGLKTDLKVTGLEAWIGPQRALMNMVMNLRIFIKGGEFLN